MLKGFRAFVMRGNVLDLAVAFVIGVAFTAVVGAVVAGFVNPLIAAIFGKPNLDAVGHFTIGKGQFDIGIILTAVVNFVLVAAAVYFLVVAPLNALRARAERARETGDAPPTETELLTQIRDELRARG